MAGSRPSRQDVLEWLREAAAALDYAHEKGVVHRDVKPRNLLFDDRGRLVVADFGIARAAFEEALTVSGELLGTAAYISPEQALGEPATPASDRYALRRGGVRGAHRRPALRRRHAGRDRHPPHRAGPAARERALARGAGGRRRRAAAGTCTRAGRAVGDGHGVRRRRWSRLTPSRLGHGRLPAPGQRHRRLPPAPAPAAGHLVTIRGAAPGPRPSCSAWRRSRWG